MQRFNRSDLTTNAAGLLLNDLASHMHVWVPGSDFCQACGKSRMQAFADAWEVVGLAMYAYSAREAWIFRLPVNVWKTMHFSTRKEAGQFKRTHNRGHFGVQVGPVCEDGDFYTVRYRRRF